MSERVTVESNEDRRLQRRVALEIPVQARPTGWVWKKSALEGRTVDLALCGLQLRFQGETKVKEGDTVELSLEEPEAARAIRMEGRVQWLAPDEDRPGSVLAGVELTDCEFQEYNQWLELLYKYLEE